jgi:hypothetical protein
MKVETLKNHEKTQDYLQAISAPAGAAQLQIGLTKQIVLEVEIFVQM